MKRFWSTDELHEHWSVGVEDLAQVPDRGPAGRLGFVAQLAFYRVHHAFPDHRGAFTPIVIEHLAEQVGVFAWNLNDYDWGDRTGRRHRESILVYLGVRSFGDDDEAAFRGWLLGDALPKEPNDETLDEWITAWLRRTKVARPGEHRLDRALHSIRRTHDDGVHDRVLGQLDADTRRRLGELLQDKDGQGAPLQQLRADPRRLGLKSLFDELDKLKTIRDLAIPAGILKTFHPDLIKRYRRRSATESVWDLGQHPKHIQLPLLVFYCVPREAELIDGLVELLMQITHKMTDRAERRVDKELVAEVQRVRGKEGILYRIAEATSEHPDGVVRDVIFPVASEETILNLVKEYRASGGLYKRKVHMVLAQ